MSRGSRPVGRVRITPPGVLFGWGVAGLLLGRGLRPVAVALDQHPPVVAWSQAGVLLFVAIVLAVTAWNTRQALKRPQGIEANRAVNRLVLAKACALVGALLAGGYAGYALAWVSSDVPLADERMLRSGVAALCGLVMCGAALLLEWTCRIKEDDPNAPSGVEADPAGP